MWAAICAKAGFGSGTKTASDSLLHQVLSLSVILRCNNSFSLTVGEQLNTQQSTNTASVSPAVYTHWMRSGNKTTCSLHSVGIYQTQLLVIIPEMY